MSDDASVSPVPSESQANEVEKTTMDSDRAGGEKNPSADVEESSGVPENQPLELIDETSSVPPIGPELDSPNFTAELDNLQAEAEALTEQARTFKKRAAVETDTSRDESATSLQGDSREPSDAGSVSQDLHSSPVGSRGEGHVSEPASTLETNENARLRPHPDDQSAVTPSEGAKEGKSAAGEGQEDQEDDDEEVDDEDEDDPEPLLKYSRLGGNLANVLAKDSVSTVCVSDRFLAIGTHAGHVHILDLSGNDIKRFRSLSASVTELAIDNKADFLASSSDDGRVAVNSLFSAESSVYDFRRPVKAVALEPDFGKSSSRAILSGGRNEQLILSTKSWFGSMSNTTIHSGEGTIFTIKWRGTLVAWANEQGVQLYDMASSKRIGHVKRRKGSPRPDLFRPNLFWKSDTELLIGWANSVTVVRLKAVGSVRGNVTPPAVTQVVSAVGLEQATKGAVEWVPEVKATFKTEFVVCGIAPLHKNKDLLVLLTVEVDSSILGGVDVLPPTAANPKTSPNPTRVESQPPEVRVFDYSGRELANDVLASVVGYQIYQPNDYRLDYLEFDQTYYIVSPKDIIVARPRDMADHIEWLLERQRYEEALKAAESAGDDYSVKGRLKVDDIIDIGQKYLQALVAEGNYSQAASLCPKILRQDPNLWEQWVYTFADHGQLATIAPHMPVSKPELRPRAYEVVLEYALEKDHRLLVELSRLWPPSVYDLSAIVKAAEIAIGSAPDDTLLMEAASEFQAHAKNWGRQLFFSLKLGSPGAISLVGKHNLYSLLEGDMIRLVFEYDQRRLEADKELAEQIEEELTQEDRADGGTITNYLSIATPIGRVRAATLCPGAQMLVDCADKVLPATVVESLRDFSGFLHIYLDALWKKERQRRDLRQEGAPYHTLQVELYAEYDPMRLLDFLRTSSNYSVSAAYDVCHQRDMVPEMVFLLGKMGDNKKALALIIERMADVRGAINFAKDQDDPALWEDLLAYSMDKPPFILGLLENIGSSLLDPASVVRRIPEGLPVIGLKGAVRRLLEDYGVQLYLRIGCGKIVREDAVGLLEALVAAQTRGWLVADKPVACSSCSLPIAASEAFGNGLEDDASVLFTCRHWFHSSCLLAQSGARSAQTDSYLAESQEEYLIVLRRRIRPIYAGDGLSRLEEDEMGGLPKSSSDSYRIRRRFAQMAFTCPLCHADGSFASRGSGKLFKSEDEIRSEQSVLRSA